VHLSERDIVRNRLVQDIVLAYEGPKSAATSARRSNG
jgi:phosphate starvation-inducible protein PhoH